MSASRSETIGWISILLVAGLGLPQTVPPAMPTSGARSRVDLAEFATALPAPDRGVQWHGPMRVREVRLSSTDGKGAGNWHVEWWGSVWPDHGTGGWMRLDDPWNGNWVRVANPPSPDQDGGWVIPIPPLTREEWSRALEPNRYPDKKSPEYRQTLKLRVVDDSGQAVAAPVKLRVFGDATWAEDVFDLHYRFTGDSQGWFRLEITHGELLKLEPLSARVDVHAPAWSAQGLAGASAGVRATVRYVQSPDPNGEERTRITLRSGAGAQATGFSFVPQDVPTQDAMRVPDFGFLIARAYLCRTWENDPGPGSAWPKRVRHRLVEQPEATRESALAGLPRLSPARDVPLGVPSARQEFFVSPEGNWAILGLSLNTDNGKDAKRWVFRPSFGNERLDEELRATLDTRPEATLDRDGRDQLRRSLEEEHLPLVHVTWRTGPLAYHHALATTILEGDYGDDSSRRGDETVVLLTRLTLTNASVEPQTATVNLRFNLDWPLHLGPDGLITVDWPTNRVRPEGLVAVRGQAVEAPPVAGPAGAWELVPSPKPGYSAALRWRAPLGPQEGRTLYFKAPFVELLDPRELERLKSIRFEPAVGEMLDYWRRRLATRMQLAVPDPMLNHFYQANLWHTLITTDRDPETGLYNQGVGTVRYRVFANETVMIARYLDLVGEHREAERFLEPMLHFQGQEALTGRFSTREGVFHSAGQYTHGQYAMNHGFVLWGVADHYRLTRDRAYLERVAPQLVKGCDFLIRERQATLTPPGQPRSPTHGLAPASSLEDVIEFQYWLAANSYFHLGLKSVGQALGDIGHAEAERFAREAEAYRRDIEIAAREAATRAATVRLRDHAWIPYVPSRIFQWRHLTEGWIREALYPALHLAAGEVVSCRDPLITWMLDDLEDNIFFSWQSGYNVADYDQTWFEHGAVTLQPCLLELAPTYLARDEIPAALRNFWNTYALSIYPDVHCFAEWAPRFGQGGGPVYKTSDEARFLIWLRQLIIWDNGEEVWYGRGLPRAWLDHGQEVRLERACTPFGETSLLCRSEVQQGRIRTRIQLPSRQLPKTAWLRLRHPQKRLPAEVQINGKALPYPHQQGENIRLPLEELSPGQPVEILATYSE